ncbi:MAG: hypothetical protein ACT4QB_05925 [Gammaproteobacteria bacterium]
MAYCAERGINAAQYGYRHLRPARVVIGRIRRFIISSGSVCMHTTGGGTLWRDPKAAMARLTNNPCACSAPDRLLMLLPSPGDAQEGHGMSYPI